MVVRRRARGIRGRDTGGDRAVPRDYAPVGSRSTNRAPPITTDVKEGPAVEKKSDAPPAKATQGGARR